MFYREVGQFKSSYAADQAIFPIAQDRWFVIGVLLIAFLVVPFFVTDYTLNAVYLPFLIFGLASLGLNILTGYCGQLSFGTGAFMGVGAYSAFKLTTAMPELNLIIVFLVAGLAAIGIRDIARHRRAMLSMYAVASGAIWLRLGTAAIAVSGLPFDTSYAVAAWLGGVRLIDNVPLPR